MSAEGAVWFYSANGSPEGPVDRAALAREVARGVVTGATFVWREGFGEWVPLASVPELRGVIAPQPPPPGPVRPPPPPDSGRTVPDRADLSLPTGGGRTLAAPPDSRQVARRDVDAVPEVPQRPSREMEGRSDGTLVGRTLNPALGSGPGAASSSTAPPRGFSLEVLGPSAALLVASVASRGAGDGAAAAERLLASALARATHPVDRARLGLGLAAMHERAGTLKDAELDELDPTLFVVESERRALARLLRVVADRHRAAGRIAEADAALLEALALSGGEQGLGELSVAERAAVFARTGRLAEAADAALEDWKARPEDPARIQAAASRHLQLALTLDASREEGGADADATLDDAWRTTIALFAIMRVSPEFWAKFGAARAAVYAVSFDDAKVRDAADLVQRRLMLEVGGLQQRHRDAGRSADERRLGGVQSAYRAECEVAERVASLRSTAGMPPIPIACGPTGLDLLGLRQRVFEAAQQIASRPGAPATAMELAQRLGQLGSGWALLSAGALDDADAFARALLAKDPVHREALRLLAGVDVRRVAEALAKTQLEAASKLLEGWSQRPAFPPEFFAPLEQLVRALMTAKQHDRAIGLLRAIRAKHDQEKLRAVEANVWLAKCESAFQGKRVEEEFTCAAAAYALLPAFPMAQKAMLASAFALDVATCTRLLASGQLDPSPYAKAAALASRGAKTKDSRAAERDFRDAEKLGAGWTELLGFVYFQLAVIISEEMRHANQYTVAGIRARVIHLLQQAAGCGNDNARKELLKLQSFGGRRAF